MTIVLVGLNHRTAPVELREKLYLSECGLRMALDELNQNRPQIQPGGALHESVILSTCNRMEIYGTGEDASAVAATITHYLSQLQGIPDAVLAPHLYMLQGDDAVEHLLHVAAGLDSMILGEPQILGQINAAFTEAREAGTTGPVLNHLFPQAIHAGKRAHSETEISRRTTSTSNAAALLVKEQVDDLAGARVLVVGAGEMAKLATGALAAQGAGHIEIINRTYARAQALATQIAGHVRPWPELHDALAEADAVISATGAPHIVLYEPQVRRAMHDRADHPLVVVDIAVPRDVEESVGDVPGVRRYDIDDLQHVVDENLAQRQSAIPAVEAIITDETQKFLHWLNSRRVVPVIVDLRGRMEAMARDEIEQALNKLGDLDEHDREVINQLVHRVLNKVLHEPTVRLKEQAANGNGYVYADAVRELFALEEVGTSNNQNGNGRQPN